MMWRWGSFDVGRPAAAKRSVNLGTTAEERVNFSPVVIDGDESVHGRVRGRRQEVRLHWSVKVESVGVVFPPFRSRPPQSPLRRLS